MKITEQLTKHQLQYSISKRAAHDTQLTNNWLKNGGLTDADLLRSKTLLLQAQKTAHEMLLHHTALIPLRKQEWLKDFGSRCKNKRLCQRVTDKQCVDVLKYSKSVNRQVFKLNRQK